MNKICRARRDVDVPFDFNLATKRVPLERVLALAKKGVAQPGSLDDEEVKIVCDMLLTQYAQMGIS